MVLQDITKALERFHEAAKRHDEQQDHDRLITEIKGHMEPSTVPKVQDLHRTVPIRGVESKR